jgi:hypothetical protein
LLNISAGVANSHQFEQRGDVWFLSPVVEKRFAEIENNVWREGADLFHHIGNILVHRQRVDLVPQALQTGDDIGFGGAVFFLA